MMKLSSFLILALLAPLASVSAQTRLIRTRGLSMPSGKATKKSSEKSGKGNGKTNETKKSKSSKTTTTSKKKKGKKSGGPVFSGAEACGVLERNDTATSNPTSDNPQGCDEFEAFLLSLQAGTLAREDFAALFDIFILSDLIDFISAGVPDDFDLSIIDIDKARNGLEAYIFDGLQLNDDDFTLLENATFPEAPMNRMLVDKDYSDIVPIEKSLVRRHDTISDDTSSVLSLFLELKDVARRLQADDDLSPECIDVIVRIVIEIIGLILGTLGVRSVARRPFQRYFVQIKGGQLNGLVLEGYRRSRGRFDASFFVGLVVGFLSILTWDDIKNSLSTLGSDDWLSLAIGISLAVAGTLASGGLAVFFLVTSLFFNAMSLAGDIAELGKCFALCDDGFTQSGGQQTTTYVVALDRSDGVLTFSYEAFSIPDQFELIYEGNVIFTTGGLVSGGSTITRTINGDEERISVRVSAPRSGTAWRFSLDCPVPNIFL